MNMEKKKNFIINTLYYALIALFTLVAVKYMLPISLPFVFGFLGAYLVVWVSNRFPRPNRWIRLILAILLYGGLWTFAGFLTYRGGVLLAQLAELLPTFYENYILPHADDLYLWVSTLFTEMEPAVAGVISNISNGLVSTLGKLMTGLSKGILNLVSGIATGVPSALLGILAMMFSTFFVVVDFDRIRDFLQTNLRGTWKERLYTVRDYLTDTLFVVLRSYLLIMLLTFTELSILFALFGIKHGVAKAALIAVFDILPLLGTGGIMIPWAVVSMIAGNLGLGIRLLVIYGIVTVIRNYVEPRIVGGQLGLHPIISLVSMFIGLRLFGFLGMFGLPVTISFLWKQYQSRAAEKAPAE